MQALRGTLARYGKIGIVVHFSFSTISIASCYYAISRNLPVDRALETIGLKAPQAEGEASSETLQETASVASTFAMAMVLHKVLLPIRAPITVIVTPVVARVLARAGFAF
eukprot:TRINITY_DN50428_c0_g1_i1.p1 TRINITY_DN50428_c0_g1~~TRINITY_DN50428_c0_g1_i1.p1  ORF type:complete len:110 (-),score=15.53 TRINITY_DN50428_c0_g1_i1:116-445(-)